MSPTVEVPEVDEVVGLARRSACLLARPRIASRLPLSVSTAKRDAIAQSSPTASRTFSSVSSQKRARFSKRAAVLVGALVVVRQEELQRQVASARRRRRRCRSRRRARAWRRRRSAAGPRDVVLVHARRRSELISNRTGSATAARRRARLDARRMRPAVPELDAGQRAVLVDLGRTSARGCATSPSSQMPRRHPAWCRPTRGGSSSTRC